MRGRPEGRRRRCAGAAFGTGAGTPGPVGAVAGEALTHSARRRPKPCGPDAPAAHHPGLSAQRRTAVPTARCCLVPPAVGRRWAPTRGRRLKGQPTGGRTEQASNIARGTPGDRRTCGYRTPGPVRHRAASAPRGAEVPGSEQTGLRSLRTLDCDRPRRPAPPRIFVRAAKGKTKGRRPATENSKPPGRGALARSFSVVCPLSSDSSTSRGSARRSSAARRRSGARSRRSPPGI
jgi:hypothetical protein